MMVEEERQKKRKQKDSGFSFTSLLTQPKKPEVEEVESIIEEIVPPPAQKKTPAANPFASIFGKSNSTEPEPVVAEPEPEPTKPSSSNPFASLFQPKSENLPLLSDWKQNKNGSITGVVSNREGFEDGTWITTSTITTRNVKPGSIVTTSGGSKYKLQ